MPALSGGRAYSQTSPLAPGLAEQATHHGETWQRAVRLDVRRELADQYDDLDS
jgi:hypothetical protein